MRANTRFAISLPRSKRKRPSCIPGIVYREGGEIKLSPRRDNIADLDALPYPAWIFCPTWQSITSLAAQLPASSSSSLMSSRGCNGTCTFCARPLYGENTGRTAPSTPSHGGPSVRVYGIRTSCSTTTISFSIKSG